MTEVNNLVEKQKSFFYTGATKDVKFRIEKLKVLYKAIKDNEERISQALLQDLNKAPFESYEAEIGIVLGEISFVLKNLKKWTKSKRVPTPLMHFPSKSRYFYEPYGVVLIMSPWNYPFLLSLVPLIGAICAGNCCVLKPSQYSTATSSLIGEILGNIYDEKYIGVVQGGRESNSALLEQRFDYIFFTGSPNVGHIVMESAAKFLTPVTLELGGKSPCIVDSSANVDLSAKRIVWGKFINAGQTCIAPDYILVEKSVKNKLINRIIFYIKQFYGEDPIHCDDFPKIINEKHFNRLCGLMEGEHICFGGKSSKELNKIAPTILDQANWESPVMNEEIFGPLLPVISFNNYDDLLNLLKVKEKPLALYLFTSNKKVEKRVINELSFGGGCINDTVIHIANSNLGFGGVGNSGMGQYHGKYSFETFSHRKGITKKSNFVDIKLRYPPFRGHIGLIKKIIK